MPCEKQHSRTKQQKQQNDDHHHHRQMLPDDHHDHRQWPKRNPQKKTAGNVHKNLPNQPIFNHMRKLERTNEKIEKAYGLFSIKNFLRINQTEIPTSSTQQKIKIITTTTTTEKH